MTTFNFILSAAFILSGILVLITGTIGIFRVKYVLGRLHCAALLDSLGLLLITSGMIIINGFSFASLKLIIILMLFWIAAPVCSHLVAALEVSTNPELKKTCEIVETDAYESFQSDLNCDKT
ncbi:MAG: monovalent cation/H(+) antiporter subunit G [Butyrivibrio sp.]|nr:monovalent cation/H(+) antiporter subunit G [Butyrivibrio sp.]